MPSTIQRRPWPDLIGDQIEVLHVDDDPQFLDLTASFLSRESDRFTVRTATTPSDALDRDIDDLDCLVLDYDMPEMSGVELLDAVRKRDPHVPVILFTGKGSEEVASEAISKGVTDYIQKGSSQDRYDLLANRIRNAVERYRAREQTREVFEAVELVNEGVSILDDGGSFLYLNRRYAEIVDVDRDELVGRHWSSLYRDGDVDHVQEEILEPLQADGGTWSGGTLLDPPGDGAIRVDHTLAYTDNDRLICLLCEPREADPGEPFLR